MIEPSPLDMRVDGYDLSSGVIFNSLEAYSIDETYPWHGAHSMAVNRCNGVKVSLTHDLSQTPYVLEIRAFNDGVAYRHVIAGAADAVRVPNEYSKFILPAGTTVWYHDLDGHYEAEYEKQDISEVKAGQWAGPPVTFQLPGNAGYGSITEANLVNYSGMGLESDGRRGWIVGLGHRQPINYPYELRYGREEAKRLAAPASVTGTITTPWRVVLVARDLNALVNSDILPNLCPPADPKYFPQGMKTPWVQPSLCVWDYVDRNYVPRGDTPQFDRMKDFSRMAGQIGAKYHILEGFAYGWSDEQIREFAEYSQTAGRAGAVLAAQQGSADTRGAGGILLASAPPGRGRGQDRFLRPRGQGEHRSLRRTAEEGGRVPVRDRLPRRQQADRPAADLAQRHAL